MIVQLKVVGPMPPMHAMLSFAIPSQTHLEVLATFKRCQSPAAAAAMCLERREAMEGYREIVMVAMVVSGDQDAVLIDTRMHTVLTSRDFALIHMLAFSLIPIARAEYLHTNRVN